MLDIRRILFPTDFSRAARQALDQALFLTQEFDAQLQMLHVVVPGDAGVEIDHGTVDGAGSADSRDPSPEHEKLVQELFDVADSELGQLRRAPEAKTIEIVEEKRLGYAPGPTILEYADEIGADLIVMGSHGRRGPARWFLGSVAEKVIRGAACPVMTVREQTDGQFESRAVRSIRNVLVPIDFSNRSTTALATAKEIAARFGATLQLLHIVDLQTLPAFYGVAIVEVTDRLMNRAVDQLQSAFDSAPGPDVPYSLHTMKARAAAGIVDFATEHGSDLIVIPSLGLTGVDRWLLGSTAERVARAAPCPILTLKERGESAVEQEPSEVEAVSSS